MKRKSFLLLPLLLLGMTLAACHGKSSKNNSSDSGNKEPDQGQVTPSGGDGDKTPETIAVSSVTLNKTTLTLEVNGSEQLTATVNPSNATEKTVTWTSSNSQIASVSNGLVRGVAGGTATIKAAAGGKEAVCIVTVNTPVVVVTYTVSFSSNGGTGSMSNVEAQAGSYTLPANGFTAPAGKEFAGWKVNGEGNLLQPGASITVSANVQLVAQWKDPLPAPENAYYVVGEGSFLNGGDQWSYAGGVKMTLTEGVAQAVVTFAVGDMFKINNPLEGEGDNGTWAGSWHLSPNANFEAVGTEEDNNIKCLVAGEYTIQFTLANREVPNKALVINPGDNPSVDPLPENAYYVVGKGSFLNGGAEWSYVGGIKMTLTDGVARATVTFAVGDMFKINNPVEGEGDNGTWAGSWHLAANANFEAVGTEEDNNIKCLVAGEYQLAFTLANRSTPNTALVITNPAPAKVPVSSVQLNKTELSLYVGFSETLVATVLPENATVKTVHWSGNGDIVKVGNDGGLKGLSAGQATVRATSTDDETKFAECVVTVSVKPDDVVQTGLFAQYNGGQLYVGEGLDGTQLVLQKVFSDESKINVSGEDWAEVHFYRDAEMTDEITNYINYKFTESDKALTKVYVKLGEFSTFFAVEIVDKPVVINNYVLIGESEVKHELVVNNEAVLADGQEAELMLLGAELKAGDELKFYYGGELIAEHIGPDANKVNQENNVKIEDDKFLVKVAGTNDIYFKVWNDGFSFWVNGGAEILAAHTLRNFTSLVNTALVANAKETEYSVIGLSLAKDDVFKIKMSADDSDWRGFEDLKTGGASANFVEDDSDDTHKIKCSVAGKYNIYVGVAADAEGVNAGKSIWIEEFVDRTGWKAVFEGEDQAVVNSEDNIRQVEIKNVEMTAGQKIIFQNADGSVKQGFAQIKDDNAVGLANFQAGANNELQAKEAGTYDFYIDISLAKGIWVVKHSTPGDKLSITFTVSKDVGMGNRVYLVGDFCSWSVTDANAIAFDYSDGVWSATIEVDPDTVYHCKLVRALWDSPTAVDEWEKTGDGNERVITFTEAGTMALDWGNY